MILITGYRGWIGSLLADEFDEFSGIDVRDGTNLITCALPPPEEVDIIYHLAAQSSVEYSWYDPIHDADNLRMTIRLVHAYPEAKLIYTNSAASKDRSSPYGFSKWACAEYIKQFHNNYVICTLPNVYGEGSRSVVDIFKELDEVEVYGSGDNTRTYVHVDDIIQALLKAQDWRCGEYELGNGIATSVIELAQGKKVNHLPPRMESKESVIQNSTPNWEPKINVFEYLKDV